MNESNYKKQIKQKEDLILKLVSNREYRNLSYEDNRFCVYGYKCSFSGNFFYIGSGTKTRAYDFTKSRSKELLEILKDKNSFSVIIIEDELNKDESLALENYFIDKYKDTLVFNINKSVGNVKLLIYDNINSIFYLDKTSKTGIRWKSKISRKTVVGKEAGCEGSRGYYVASFNNTSTSLHRIVWVLHNKRNLSSKYVINHIDSDTSNNSPDNLVACTQQENSILRMLHDSSERGKSVSSISGVILENSCISYRCYFLEKEKSIKYNIEKLGFEKALEMAMEFSMKVETLIRHKQKTLLEFCINRQNNGEYSYE